MYTSKINSSRTNSDEKGSASEETKLDDEGARQVDASRSICYGLTWTPSRDEKLSTNETFPPSLSPRILNTCRINDRRGKCSFSKPYELNQYKDLPKTDRERYFELHKNLSAKTSTAVVASKDLDSYEYWLSGEKFFETPPKNYNKEHDIHTIPTRDKSDIEDIKEKTKDKEHLSDDVSLDVFELPTQRVYDSGKTLINKIDDIKSTKEMNKNDDAINKIRRISSAFLGNFAEENVTKKSLHDPSSRSTVENITSSHWNLLESVSTLGQTNVHNHIYLSSGYLDRYCNVPLSKIIKLSRKNARVRGIRRRILKKPKRSKTRLVGTAYPIGSMIETESVNNNSSNEQTGRILPKKNVFDVLAEIEAELLVREQSPSCIAIDTSFISDMKRTLNEVAERYKDYIRSNSNDREEVAAMMERDLLKLLHHHLDHLKEVKQNSLQKDQCRKQDCQSIESLKNDTLFVVSHGFKTSSSDWKVLVNKIMSEIWTLTNEICTIEENKENITKPINCKMNDQVPAKRPCIIKLDGKVRPVKNAKRLSIKEENQVDTQMSLLSKAQPTVSIGKLKACTKDLDGYRDRIKMKEIQDQRDRTLKENEYRTERRCLAKPRKSVHTVLNYFENRVNVGASLENPKVIKDRTNNNAAREKDSTMTPLINADILQKRQSSNNVPHPVWKPGGAFKSYAANNPTVLHAEPTSRRTIQALCDKENPDLRKSVPVKHANPSEPTASGRNILRDNQRNENFRKERITKLCKFLAETKMQKGSKNGANAVSETRSSMYTQSEVPLSDTSATKIRVKSSEVNLSRQNSGSKPRPGIHKFFHSNSLQQNTRALFNDKLEPQPSKIKLTAKFERNNSPSNFSMKLNETNKIENENVLSQQNLVTSDTAKSAMILLNDKDKLQNTQSSKTMELELAKNTSQTNSMSSNSQNSPETTLNLSNTVDIDCDLRSESRPSFILVADASCNAELSSTPNSTTMIPSSKCCQVSLSSTSSKTSLNYDRPRDKNQSINATSSVDKDSLETSTDDESNYQTPLSFDPRKQKNKHDLSLNSLKLFLHDLGIGADVIQKVEKQYQLKTQGDRQESTGKLNKTSLSNSYTSKMKSPLIKTTIDPEPDNQSVKRYEFKSDDSRSIEFIGSSDYSINGCTEKIDETTIESIIPEKSQTISNLKTFCDACTDAEDMKSDCSTYVDATVSCYELGIKTSSKDVATEIFAEDKSILSPRRMVETQTNPHSSFTDNVVELGKEEEEKKENTSDRCIETEDSKFQQPNYENEDNISQHDASKNGNGKSSECLLHLEDGTTIDESPLSQCFIHQLEDIKEQLQNVDAKLNKLQEPAKETSDAFSQISMINSIAPKSMGISTISMTSGSSKKFLEESNMDSMETENLISSDIINAFQTIVWYASNWNEALRLHREYSNSNCFEEYEKGSTCSLSSDEAVNASKNATFIKTNIPATCEFVNEDTYRSCEIGPGQSSYVFERPSHVFDESKMTDLSDESDETTSLASFGFEDFYGEEMTKPTSQKSSRGSIFFETQDKTDKVPSSTSIKDGSSATMKHSERIRCSSENKKGQEMLDPPEFVLSTEDFLLLTYLTICAFVFCCLKFSMTCESSIL